MAYIKKFDKVSDELLEKYRAIHPDAGFLHISTFPTNEDLTFCFDAMKDEKLKKSIKITPVSSKTLKTLIGRVHIEPRKGKSPIPSFAYNSGMFQITVKGQTIMASLYEEGLGRNIELRTIMVGQLKALKTLASLKRRNARERSIPKTGIYRILNINGMLRYSDASKSLTQVPVIHPILGELKSDMKQFFNNVKMYTRYNQPGVRKVILIGPPGTGKSCMLAKMAHEYKDKAVIGLCTSISEAALFLFKAALVKRKAILILEDADSSLSSAKAGSDILNFLDGQDQPINPAGTYVIFTTNHPEAISPRILKRPGRIDRPFKVGKLEGNDAAECAQLYLPEEVKIDSSDLSFILDDMTGAEIREIIRSSVSFAISNKRELDASIIAEVTEQMKANLKEIYEYAQEDAARRPQMGFVAEEQLVVF